MAKFQAWVCDRCRQVHNNDQNLWTCAMVMTNGGRNPSYTNHRELHHSESRLLCRQCLVKFGIYDPPKDEPKPKPDERLGLEDMFREFVWNIAQEVVDASR